MIKTATQTLAQRLYALHPSSIEWNPRLGLWCWTGSYQPLTQDECDELELDNRGPR